MICLLFNLYLIHYKVQLEHKKLFPLILLCLGRNRYVQQSLTSFTRQHWFTIQYKIGRNWLLFTARLNLSSPIPWHELGAKKSILSYLNLLRWIISKMYQLNGLLSFTNKGCSPGLSLNCCRIFLYSATFRFLMNNLRRGLLWAISWTAWMPVLDPAF